ncbi:hypothetical protein GCM10010357_17720 [Streptomyces luteireticuli]|uniref:Uncharacterized protein n=1 Tax=Streptomyces luteireticuli TaxID=173858 RepID=A0ABP3IBP7_9ACTN
MTYRRETLLKEAQPEEARPTVAEERRESEVPPLEPVLVCSRVPFVVNRYGGITRGANV